MPLSSPQASAPALPATPALPHVPTPVLLEPHPGLTHGGIESSYYHALHTLGAVFPVTVGLLLYGWRAALLLLIVGASTAVGVAMWRTVGTRGRQLRVGHALWLSLLLGLMLPASLADFSTPAWTLLPAAGFALAIFIWLVGGFGSGRIQPVVITYLFLLTLFNPYFVQRSVLQKNKVLRGDVLDAAPLADLTQPWGVIRLPGADAVATGPAADRLSPFTSGAQSPDRTWLSLEGLIRDYMPPLENLIVAGHPGPIGAASGVAVIIGGLFLLYRGLIDYRIPLVIFVAAYVAFLVLPIPVVITDAGPQWRWLAIRDAHAVGWPLALTFVHYELFAGAIPFTAFFLATTPAARPMARRARVLYAALIGFCAAFFQLYASAASGAYVALFIVSLLTPTLDLWFRPRTLV